jgi:hypothetical protein
MDIAVYEQLDIFQFQLKLQLLYSHPLILGLGCISYRYFAITGLSNKRTENTVTEAALLCLCCERS